MNRTFITAMTMLAAMLSASAQDYTGLISDGVNWSENNYGGTARSMSMGNAMTALGGDLGSIQINPAGSAVAPYGQVSLTMGASVSMTRSTGETQGMFQDTGIETNVGFVFPNGGFTLKFDTGNSGLKRFTFGFLASGTNVFNYSTKASGWNDRISSFAGYVADNATCWGYTPEEMRTYNVDYCTSTCYNSGVIAPLKDIENFYLGTTENIDGDGNITVGGPLYQQDCHRITGSKMDYIMNFGFDIADIVYLGATLGLTNMRYRLQDVFSEKGRDEFRDGQTSSDGFDSGFRDFTYNYSYRATGTGVYGKFGIILTPVAGLRFGAAIQTPTRLRINEYAQHSAIHNDSRYSTSTSPESNWIYDVISPMRFNLGLAYTINSVAALSVDYERVNYGMMRFREYYGEDMIHFDNVNNEIRKGTVTRASDIIRAGTEVKITQEFALRAGYVYTGAGSSKYGSTHTASLGCGYDSPGSFFCDIAAKLDFLPRQRLKVYEDYGYDDKGVAKFVGPVVTTTAKMLNIVATLGWRF